MLDGEGDPVVAAVDGRHLGDGCGAALRLLTGRHPLPRVGPISRERHVPALRVDVPLDGRLQPPLAAGRCALDHRRHGLEGGDELAVGDLVDLPGPRAREVGEVGFCVGLRGGLGGVGQVVADAEHLQVVDAQLDVERAVGQVALRTRRRRGELRLVDEVVRRGRRRLEEEALHRADAAVGPVRQQHRRHRGAVGVEVGVVLPHGPPAALGRPDRGHGVDQGLVLGVLGLALVAGVVPPGPVGHVAAVPGRDGPP